MRLSDRWLYPQRRKLLLGDEAGHLFDEDCVEIRVFYPRFDRRRLVFWDCTAGVEFSSHALARMVERGDMREGLLDTVQQGLFMSLPYFAALQFLPIQTSVCIPFGGGLVLAQGLVLDHLEPFLVYENTLRRNEINESGHTIWSRGEDVVAGFRVATYLSFDALRDDQEIVLKAWSGLAERFDDLFTHFRIAVMVPELKRTPLKHADYEPFCEAMLQLVETPEWTRLANSHSGAVLMGAAIS